LANTFAMYATAITATNAVTLVSLGTSATALVRSLTLCNAHTASTASMDVFINKGTNTDAIYLSRYTQVASQQTLHVLPEPIVLDAGDSLKASGAVVSLVHAVASVMKIT